jgi:hypothetical protein
LKEEKQFSMNNILNNLGKKSFWLTLIASILLIVNCYQKAQADYSQNIKTMTYQPSQEDFPNPERGLFARFSPLGTNPRPPLKLSELKQLRQENITLIRRIYLISDFRDRPLSSAFLAKVSADMETARQAGIKIILRFAYNWLGGGDDAPKSRILEHLEQLKPVLADNYDVIAYMEAGFIGYWGEWNRSSHGLRENPAARKEILFKALSVLPSDRMVALRYTYYKRDAFRSEQPLTPEQAFDGSCQARVGAHNDCFLASIDDWGTYNHTDPVIVDEQKNYLNLDNRYVVQGGELCNPSPYDDCPNALNELARMRWSALNVDHNDGAEVLQGWQEQGCFPEIKRRLGYRFRLIKSVIPQQIKPGAVFAMNFEIFNDGWASPYNPRGLELILRDRKRGTEYYLPLKQDPRTWLPGYVYKVEVAGVIPPEIRPGTYQVLLNLPDPTPRLYNRPEYSIRLANQNVWEESTGYNYLQAEVVVTSEPATEPAQGDWFKRRDATEVIVPSIVSISNQKIQQP